jgi:hypothetical protein
MQLHRWLPSRFVGIPDDRRQLKLIAANRYMFPTFIEESSRQGMYSTPLLDISLTLNAGANPDVIAKLQFFKSMHNVRTVFRGIYSVALCLLAADGLTSKQKINHQE